ncbi:MAG: hypothetical protein WDN69_24120 [Aliidongia sp.]
MSVRSFTLPMQRRIAKLFRFGQGRSLVRLGLLAGLLPLLLAACSGPGAGSKPPAAIPPVAAVAPAQSHPVLEVAQLASLRAMSTEALVARLGEPGLHPERPAAEIWQYRGSTCVLDVFLYPEDGQMKVAARRDARPRPAPGTRERLHPLRPDPFGQRRVVAETSSGAGVPASFADVSPTALTWPRSLPI